MSEETITVVAATGASAHELSAAEIAADYKRYLEAQQQRAAEYKKEHLRAADAKRARKCGRRLSIRDLGGFGRAALAAVA